MAMLTYECFQKHKILPSTLHAELLNRWNMHDRTELLDNYYLLYWDAAWFHNQLVNGVIEHKGIRYLIIYHNCKPHDICKGQVCLSFRQAIADFNIPAYVLVSKGSGNHGTV